MSSPCHIELILTEKDAAVAAAVRSFTLAYLLDISTVVF